VLPTGVSVTLLADRGFADQKFFRFLDEEFGLNISFGLNQTPPSFTKTSKIRQLIG